MDKHFQPWRPLNSANREFRVLHIVSSEEEDSKLSCNLSVISLDKDPVYEALSYTWGDPTITKAILLHNEPWQITSNLSDALHRFRSLGILGPIFIDALCINQNDLQEKSSQIPLMGQIYQNAATVRCWLGMPSPGITRAIEILEMVAEDALMTEIEIDGEPVGNADFRALNDLAERQYWSRVWVLQEFVVPKSGIIHCGAHSISREQLPTTDQLRAAIKSLSQLGFPKNLSPKVAKQRHSLLQSLTDNCLAGAFHGMLLQRETHIDDGPFIVTESTFPDLAALRATVLHDHLYGILGLTNPKFAKKIIPDYSQSTAAVFTDFAFKWLRHHGTARLLELGVGQGSNELQLPSWVPSFSSLEYSTQPEWEGEFEYTSLTRPEFVMVDERILRVQGFCLDHIEASIRAEIEHPTRPGKFLDLPDGENSSASDKRAVLHHRVWRKFFDLPNIPDDQQDYVGGGSLEDAYWLTLVEGLADTDNLSESAISSCKTWLAQQSTSTRRTVSQTIRKHVSAFHAAVDTSVEERHLFRTAKGYIGLNDRNVPLRQGDAVYFIATAAAPFILRPVSGLTRDNSPVYELVSCAYVHGTMLRCEDSKDEDESETNSERQDQIAQSHPQEQLAQGKWSHVYIT